MKHNSNRYPSKKQFEKFPKCQLHLWRYDLSCLWWWQTVVREEQAVHTKSKLGRPDVKTNYFRHSSVQIDIVAVREKRNVFQCYLSCATITDEIVPQYHKAPWETGLVSLLTMFPKESAQWFIVKKDKALLNVQNGNICEIYFYSCELSGYLKVEQI